ncbi:MAG: cytochrome c [Rhodospirillaceae bacterium]|nr:cytochrome c [Rhodospirillaceae bacterium]
MNDMKITLLIAASLLAFAVPASAGDLMAGKAKAGMCVNCHELDGSSQRPDAPHIGGQLETYLAEQLHHYKSGKRKHAIMTVIAKSLSDTDIANLASWFAAIKVTRTPPD